jgi:RNA polymerase sigma factor (sigma-70 family)
MSSDERLAQRAARGDQAAFEEIYERYHQDLYRFCLAMVGNPPDAQDALQNTMIKVLRSLPGEKRQIKLKPWLYRIARNEAVEILRRRRETAELEPEQMPVAALTETAETRERLRTLLADLEQLPERQRAALVMRELSGLDFDQIGTAFGTSAAVARQTLYEARLSLRQLDAGREMRCAEVMRELSNADGRVTRRREIQAHLRTCADCRAFQDDIVKRHGDLGALAPLPIAASAGLLKGVLGSGASASAAGGLGGAVGAGAGKAIATSALVKAAATAAVVAVVGTSAADRTGLIDLPVPGRDGNTAAGDVAGDSGTPPGLDDGHPGQSGSTRSAGSPGDKGSRSEGGGGGSGAEPAATQTGQAGTHGASRSDAGTNPPGGGYGRSASQRHGRPDSLPEASAKGRQTAAGRRPEGAGAPSSPGSASGQAQAGGRAPASKPPAPPKSESAPTDTGPPSEADSHGEGDASQQGTQGAPPGLEG